MKDSQHHFRFFGRRCRDRVTGFEGVGSSVCFDLYGCIQTALSPPHTPGSDKVLHSHWFDNNRLEIVDSKPVMTLPDYLTAPVAVDQPGGFEKSVPSF